MKLIPPSPQYTFDEFRWETGGILRPKRYLWGLFIFLLMGCNSRPVEESGQVVSGSNQVSEESIEEVLVQLPDLGRAPELKNDIWLNTDEPLQLVELRGQVVLLDMWTFG